MDNAIRETQTVHRPCHARLFDFVLTRVRQFVVNGIAPRASMLPGVALASAVTWSVHFRKVGRELETTTMCQRHAF